MKCLCICKRTQAEYLKIDLHGKNMVTHIKIIFTKKTFKRTCCLSLQVQYTSITKVIPQCEFRAVGVITNFSRHLLLELGTALNNRWNLTKLTPKHKR